MRKMRESNEAMKQIKKKTNNKCFINKYAVWHKHTQTHTHTQAGVFTHSMHLIHVQTILQSGRARTTLPAVIGKHPKQSVLLGHRCLFSILRVACCCIHS
ncbi:unnamed protein product [Ceratitis capitata]|uniref:(Mediterranean fruit fly) hypothetical protein n=1 Tax=Ceratitis capitata TaxID=7213 RepID=A0A811U7R4_CERCA|nr:unnamed protein product [Ceratitis capitata]